MCSWLYVSYTTMKLFFSKYEQSPKHIWWYLFRAWNSSRVTRLLRGQFLAPNLFSPVLFYSLILLEHNLPLSYFIAFGQTIPFCWDMLSFPISFETRRDHFGSSSNAFSIKPLDCHSYVCGFFPPFSSNFTGFCSYLS